MANDYYLSKKNGTGGYDYSGYQIQLAGNSNGAMVLKYRAATRGNPPNGGWSAPVTPPGTRTGNGSPDNPQVNDSLTPPGTIGPVSGLSGNASYATSGSNGAGYYPNHGPAQDDGDWCATTT
jgi:hypothetical protein